jgi:GNAT superfamily N-acetyltransferase
LPPDPLLEHARRLWCDLAAAPVAFTDAAVRVAVSPRSRLCPPGWAGIVALGGAAIATAPDEATAATLRHALDELPAPTLTALRDRLPIEEALGPASLAYCDAAAFHPADASAVETIPADHPDIAILLALAPAGDVDEAGLAEMTSPAFVLRSGTDVVAVSGYQTWPQGVAHISVLTAPAARGRGHARAAAGAAVAHALNTGLVPQWRARPDASRRVARALGFREFGAQLSIRLRTARIAQ